MRNAGLDESQAGIQIARRNINNLRYADDTTLMAESEEELKSLLMKVRGWKNIFHANGKQKKTGVAILISVILLSFKLAFSLSSFTLIKRMFSSSLLSAIRVVSSAYLKLLIFSPAK